MFGNSIDQAVEDKGANEDNYKNEIGSDQCGNINEVQIETIDLVQQDKEQNDLEKEFENQMMEAGIGLKDVTQDEDLLWMKHIDIDYANPVTTINSTCRPKSIISLQCTKWL